MTLKAQHAAVAGETRQPCRVIEVASFPRGYFLENIAVRSDGSLLVTAFPQCELWYVPAPRPGGTGEPVRLHTFELATMGIVEAEPDVFYVSASEPSTTGTGTGRVHRIDMSGWSPGQPIEPSTVLELRGSVGLLNGSCFVAPDVLLLADSYTRSIWRVDLSAGGKVATARRWVEHESLAHEPTGPRPRQPGVNGIRYAARTGYLYCTSSAKRLFLRVHVDARTHDPAGEPERVATGRMADDFCIDEPSGVAYVTMHWHNAVDRVSLNPAENDGFGRTVAGPPLTEEPIGPTSIAWGRVPGDYGRVAYVTTDGGVCAALGAECPPRPRSIRGTEPPIAKGIVRPAKVLRLELQPSQLVRPFR